MAVTAPTLESTTDAGLTRLATDDLALLLLIRHFENRLLGLFSEGKLNGTTHTCLGQEYVPVALRPLLTPEDFLFSNHRGHGHYLSRFEDPAGLLAEIMGRQGAVCGGVGGSQHIFRDAYLSTGVQGESLPVAVGVALHFQRTGQRRIAAVFVGDGTFGEGAVYEALNMAQLWRLPLLVLVENNGIAQTTPTSAQLAGTIRGRAAAFGIAYQCVDSIDVNAIRRQLAPHIRQAREQATPLVVEFVTQRLGPHSKGDDTRRPELIAQAAVRDWYPRYARSFPEQFGPEDRRQRELVDQVAREVEARPVSTWEP